VFIEPGTQGSVDIWGTMLHTGNSRNSFTDEVIRFFNLSNPSSRTMDLGSTQPLTEMSTRNIPGGAWSMNLFYLNVSTNYMSRIVIYVTISHLIPVLYLGSESSWNILGLCELYFLLGRAIAHWLPTAAARVRSRVWSSVICDGQSGAGVGFLRVLRFPLPIFIPPNSASS
jgi:hypothetical protein